MLALIFNNQQPHTAVDAAGYHLKHSELGTWGAVGNTRRADVQLLPICIILMSTAYS